MLKSGKKIRALRDKKKNILTLVLSEKTILNGTKNHNPPRQVKRSVPYPFVVLRFHPLCMGYFLWILFLIV